MERLFLQAVNHAEISPENAVATLRSIVDLYGVIGPPAEADDARDGTSKKDEAADTDDARVSIVVKLAERRLTALKAELSKQRDAQLATLDERLKTARKLSSNNPQRAATMYRAIINLHQDDAWAERIVAEARRRLARLGPLPE